MGVIIQLLACHFKPVIKPMVRMYIFMCLGVFFAYSDIYWQLLFSRYSHYIKSWWRPLTTWFFRRRIWGALELLEEYRRNLTGSETEDLREALTKAIVAIRSRLFQALLGLSLLVYCLLWYAYLVYVFVCTLVVMFYLSLFQCALVSLTTDTLYWV